MTDAFAKKRLKNNLTENKLGVMSVPKLLLTMSLPAMFSMLVQSLYNIVDSLFVAKSSNDALTALNLAFPLQQIMLAFALGIGVGTSTIVARRLGEKNKASADNLAQTGFKVAIIATLVFMILGSFLPRLFMTIFTKDNQIIAYGTNYLTICMVCSFGMMIEILISKILQATGNMIIPMLSQLLGAIINIILDPIFIFVCKLGIIGAGIATVMGQIISMIFVLILALKRKNIIDIMFKIKKWKDLNISLKALKEIVRIGLPVMVMNAVAGIVVIIMNDFIKDFSSQAPNALGTYFKLQSFVFMPVFGLNQGALPIMSFNFGANQEKRYKQAFFLSIAISLVIMTIGLIIFQLCPDWLISMFKNENELDKFDELLKVGRVTLKVISWSFLFAAVNIIVSTGYQSIGYGFTSLMMSLLRQVILILPLAFLLGKLWNLDVLWWSYPISDIVTMVIFTPYYFFAVKKAFAKHRKNVHLDVVKDNDGITASVVGDREEIALTAASTMNSSDNAEESEMQDLIASTENTVIANSENTNSEQA